MITSSADPEQLKSQGLVKTQRISMNFKNINNIEADPKNVTVKKTLSFASTRPG